MQYCYMDEADRLVAVVERMGNGTAVSPVRWRLRWAVRQDAAGLADSVYGERWEAVARVLKICPHAALKVFNRRGERVR
ncbi:MAG: hypothetical protein P3W97_009280 [Tepidimonas sp.]|uniref:hypothetical protein n=1 Tax=Tepidimonas sp. TaxID=2002775 RepID=UPI00259D8176|nr:hypothetical protein [Tepidimonas sp.]MDM7457422.1 hypothetical protein [Tepidimonas sp.]